MNAIGRNSQLRVWTAGGAAGPGGSVTCPEDLTSVSLSDSLPITLGEVAPGDSREEDVDLGVPDRLVDQVGTALVVEADTGDADADSPNLAAPIGGGGEGVK